MGAWLLGFIVLAHCSIANDAPLAAPARPPPAAQCRAPDDCELQSRCYWSQPAECVPHAEWREMLCGDNDPPAPSRKLETCDCVAGRCTVR